MPMTTAIIATTAENEPPESGDDASDADRIGAVANIAPSSKLLARVSVPMYTRVGSEGSNKAIIHSSDSADAAMQNDDDGAMHVCGCARR